MARAIVYPAEMAAVRIGGRRRRRRGPSSPEIIEAEQRPDTFPTKLVKYVPAETLAFVIAATTFATTNIRRSVVLVVALIGTPLYLARAARLPLWFFILAELSLLAWVIGTTDFAVELLGIAPEVGKFTLFVAVFLIPAVDELLARRATAAGSKNP
jgi:hypothetical protein